MRTDTVFLSYNNLPMGVISHKQCNSSDICVIYALLSFAMGKDECYPRQSLILKRSGVAEKTLMRSLNKLEALGFIQRIKSSFEADLRKISYKLDIEKIRGDENEKAGKAQQETESQSDSKNGGSSPVNLTGKKLSNRQEDTVKLTGKKLSNRHPSQAPIIKDNNNIIIREKSKYYPCKEENDENSSSLFCSILEKEFKKIYGEEIRSGNDEAVKSFLSAVGEWMAVMSREGHEPGSQAAKVKARPYSDYDARIIIESMWGYDILEVKNALAKAYSGGYRLPIPPQKAHKKTFGNMNNKKRVTMYLPKGMAEK